MSVKLEMGGAAIKMFKREEAAFRLIYSIVASRGSLLFIPSYSNLCEGILIVSIMIKLACIKWHPLD